MTVLSQARVPRQHRDCRRLSCLSDRKRGERSLAAGQRRPGQDAASTSAAARDPAGSGTAAAAAWPGPGLRLESGPRGGGHGPRPEPAGLGPEVAAVVT